MRLRKPSNQAASVNMHNWKFIVVDCNAVCHYYKYGLRNLGYEGQSVGVIYGFLQLIKSIQEYHNPTEFAFCWDSIKSYRKRLYPGYKDRKKELTEDEVALNNACLPQFDILRRELLPELGFKNVFHQTGIEADDIMASITACNKGRKIMVTRDKDMLQLLTNSCSMYDYQLNKNYTWDDFIVDWGITHDRWGEAKTIAGCTTDTVDGIVGVGEKTAIKYLLGKLGEHTKAYKAIVSEEGQAIIERNKPLVVLPFEKTNQYVVKIGSKISLPAFEDICHDYGFDSFMTDLEEWAEAFKMEY